MPVGPKNLRFLVDVDEVLADLRSPVMDVICQVTGRDREDPEFRIWDLFSVLTEVERFEVFARMSARGFCGNLLPKPGAIEAMRALQGRVDLFAVTNPFDSEPWVTERYQWLSEHFGLRKNKVIFGEPKYAVSGRWFLEDNLDQALSWAEGNPDGVSMLWNTPNNDTLGHDQLRVYNWDQVLSTVERDF